MANKKLKTIQFPGLPDTYTVPQVENGTNNNVAVLDGTGNVKDSAIEVSKVAKTDGSYQSLNAGTADQLNATVGVTDKVPYNFRTSGGSADIGNRLNDKLVGGTIAWNQLFTNSATSSNGVTISNNQDGTMTLNGTTTASYINFTTLSNAMNQVHKYLLCLKILNNPDNVSFYYAWLNRSGMRTDAISTGESCKICNQTTSMTQLAKSTGLAGLSAGTVFNDVKIAVMVMDLTQMFASTIADYIYSLEQTTTGAGVAWFKNLFPKPYYEYNAGELMSVCTNAHITRGFNAWDEEWEEGYYNLDTGEKIAQQGRIRSKNKIRVIGGQRYYFRYSSNVNDIGVIYFDANGNWNHKAYIHSNNVFTVWPEASYMLFYMPHQSGSTYQNNICINLSWSGYRNGEYEPYVEHRYPLSPIELRGIPKLDTSNNLYFDGDTYEKDGTVTRRYSIVDLGTLNWTYNASSSIFQGLISDLKAPELTADRLTGILCSKYPISSVASVSSSMTDQSCMRYSNNTNSYILVRDTSFTSVAEFKAAMSGVYLVYELATLTTETANAFADPQIVNDFGTEEYVDALVTAETSPRDVAIPVGHETFYQANLRDKLQNLPANASADGLYLVKQTGNKQELIAYAPESELPTSPAETGTYVLKLVDGTLTWVLES